MAFPTLVPANVIEDCPVILPPSVSRIVNDIVRVDASQPLRPLTFKFGVTAIPLYVPEAFKVNVATIFLFPSILSVQLPVPVQSPDQPVKTDPGLGLASSLSSIPIAKFPWQTSPQLIGP
jgi:hypothetical protein